MTATVSRSRFDAEFVPLRIDRSIYVDGRRPRFRLSLGQWWHVLLFAAWIVVLVVAVHWSGGHLEPSLP